MNKKRIAIASAAAAIAIGAGIGVATFASFSSERDVTGTTSAGTLKLKDLPASINWQLSGGLAPDGPAVSKTFTIKNNGSIQANKLTLTLDAYGTACTLPGVTPEVVTNCVAADAESAGGDEGKEEKGGEGGTAGITPDSELPANLRVKVSYTKTDIANPVVVSDFAKFAMTGVNGQKTYTVTTEGLPLAAGQEIEVTVELKLPKATTNEVQGDAAAMKLTAQIEQ